MRLSPLAHLVLQRHRAKPDFAMYDVAALGSGFREQDLGHLAAAYEELEGAGLVERTDEVERLFNHFFYLYKPAGRTAARGTKPGGKAVAGESATARPRTRR